MNPVEQLKNLPVEHEFFIGIDSDGCVFDTMEVKQKECFCPNFIRHFGFQAASKYAREVWEFVNLYSKTRGCNRFLAVAAALDFISQRPEFAARNIAVPPMSEMRSWIKVETKLGNPTLAAKLSAAPSPELEMLMAWSVEVNKDIARTVHDVPPFPGFREAAAKAHAKADIIVVSQTPLEALAREWQENKVDHLVNFIAAQEHGTKTEHIRYASGGKYAPGKVLMIGDAPGDCKAAKANGALFFPIVPGREEKSWAEFGGEGLDRFFAGDFAGAYQECLLSEFDRALPSEPPWKK
ncbi:MAG: hypothetical protein PHI35_09370 [Victivallaceae bacterium]|nr:hypothetical protein [Victivallaceae bacterium]